MWRKKILDELDQDIRDHIERETSDNLERGMSPEAARTAALRKFGNVTRVKEETRGVWTALWLERLVQDLRFGLRMLRKNPGFSTTAVLMLALGIGINAAIFSVFAQVLLAPLHFSDPESLYMVTSHAASLGDASRTASGLDFIDYHDQSTAFSEVAAVIPRFSEVWTGDGTPRVVNCSAVTLQFFSVMGIRPVLGRLYTPEEYTSLQNTTVLISWKFWKEQLGGDPHVIGRSIRIEDFASTIIGVVPPMPDLYADTDIWDKLTTEPSWPYMKWRANKFLDVIGRLKPGISRSLAEQQLTSILRRGEGEPNDVQVQLTPLKDFIVGPVKRQLYIVMAAVALVLLVTCMNTAALLLSRAVKRTSELAIRLGLGASRGRIRQQLLMEGLLLSVLGGGIGVALASLSISFLRQASGLALPRLEGLHLNLPAVFVSVAVVGVTSLIFAVLPAGIFSRLDVSSGLRGARTETGRAQRLPFSALIIGEIACAVVLTVCAGLLLRSFVRVHSVDPGFQPEKVMTAYLRTNYFDPRGFVFWHSVISAAANVPGASAAAVSDCMPAARANAATMLFSDRPENHDPAAEACWISPDFFRAVGSSLVRGRFFSDHDNETAAPVVIINAEAARRFFPGEDPIGKQVAVKYLALGSRMIGPPRMREIVGIVSNVRQRALDLPGEPAIYMPYEQDETHHVLASMNLFVRSAGGDPGMLANNVRVKIQSMYPNQPVERIAVMRDVVSQTLTQRIYSMRLMTASAVLALLLCALGIYGVVSYVTMQRTREFGIRMALGARRGDVLRNVLRRGCALVAAGAALGTVTSLLVTRTLAQLLFETAPFDPAIFASALLLLGAIGILACLAPAVRASQLEPRVALNLE